MLKFLIIFAITLIVMGVSLPLIGIDHLPLWQVATGAFIPASVIAYLT